MLSRAERILRITCALVLMADLSALLLGTPLRASGPQSGMGEGRAPAPTPTRGAAGSTESRWVLQNPLPTGNYLTSAFFLDGNTGWVAGDPRTILKTTDGGATWSTQPLDDAFAGPLSVFFVDSQTGWVVGSVGTILKTTDGGVTWTRQSPFTAYALSSVYFADASTGWAVGTTLGNIILKTTDGGHTWAIQSPGAGGYSMTCADANTCWVVGRSNILRTMDGGATWTSQSVANQDFYGVAFVNATTGWVVGMGGAIYKTTDGGGNWVRQTSGSLDHLLPVAFADAQNGWAVGTNGRILNTRDGGATWVHQSLGHRAQPQRAGLRTAQHPLGGRGKWRDPEDHRRRIHLDGPVPRLS